MLRLLFGGCAALLISFLISAPAYAQSKTKRDHLTPQEIEIVRDTQEIDKRIAVFVKAIDRRFMALKGEALPSTKQAAKDKEAWGELPTGTRAELLSDVAGLLNEAINGIDDVAMRDPKSELMFAAARALSSACRKYIPDLKAYFETATEEKEKAALYNAIEYAESVLEAAGKLPPAPEKSNKKSKN
jgi:hypothetical protein